MIACRIYSLREISTHYWIESFTALGTYVINFFRDGSLWNNQPTVFATLLPGYLSIPDSYCSFIGCTAQNEFCRVSCLLRSEDGYLLTQADESLSLVVSLSNVYRLNSPEDFEETYSMTNHWNGTFTIDLSIVWSGEMQLRVRDDRTQLYFAETLNATIPLLALDYSKSIFSTALPESIQVREPISQPCETARARIPGCWAAR